MNLRNKRELVARMFNIGKDRIAFAESRLDEIKEAITKQDIRELIKEGVIIIKNIQGRRKVKKIANRSKGNIRKKPNIRKKQYIAITRKLRRYIKERVNSGTINREESKDLRKKIRNRKFNSLASLKTYIGGIKK